MVVRVLSHRQQDLGIATFVSRSSASVSIVSLVLIAVYPYNLYYLCPTYLLGKLYSNTLLVSLNNRISIRDASEALEGVIDRQVVAIPGIAHTEATMDAIILEAVKPQEDLMRQPVAETEEERVDTPSTAEIV